MSDFISEQEILKLLKKLDHDSQESESERMGSIAGLAGIVETGRLASSSPTIGVSMELLVAAAVLLGGTSFKGGEGGVVGTALGVLFIGVLQNGLSLSGISSYWQNVITGVILIFAILLNHMKSKQ